MGKKLKIVILNLLIMSTFAMGNVIAEVEDQPTNIQQTEETVIEGEEALEITEEETVIADSNDEAAVDVSTDTTEESELENVDDETDTTEADTETEESTDTTEEEMIEDINDETDTEVIVPEEMIVNATRSIDYSSQVHIEEFEILDENGDPLSVDNPAYYLQKYQLRVYWSYVSDIVPLKAGDTLSIPLPKNAEVGTWYTTDGVPGDVYSNGEVIGQWQIINQEIKVVFGDNVTGITALKATFTTGSNILKNGTPNEIIQEVSVGNKVNTIRFAGHNLVEVSYRDFKYGSSSSSSSILWGMSLGNSGVREITQPELGTNYTIGRNTYLEDKMIEGASVGSINIYGHILIPYDLNITTGGGTASSTGYSYNITTSFTKITPLLNESYADFKGRLNPLEYGIWTDTNGEETIVIYFGDVGDNGLKYSDLDANFASSAAASTISRGYYPEADRQNLEDYYTKVYGDNNVVNGNIVRYSIFVRTDYDSVITDTVKNNVATITSNEEEKTLPGSTVLQSGNADMDTVKNSAVLILKDLHTGATLPNARFQLEYNNNGVWQLYSLARQDFTTDSAGRFNTEVLGVGNYRMVQRSVSSPEYNLSISPGYNVSLNTVVSEEFSIVEDQTERVELVVYNVKDEEAENYTVTYTKGDHGTFSDVVYSNLALNSLTPGFGAVPQGEAGYEFIGWSPSVSDKVVGNAVYVAQWKKTDSPKTNIDSGYVIPNTGVK